MDIKEHLLCPDCGIKLKRAEHLRCTSCGRIFVVHQNFLNLLPARLSQEDKAEEHFWAADSKEGLKAHPILTLQMKRDEIAFFFERILPNLKLKGKILEIGSGACWLSSLIKIEMPEAYVVASDVSPSALCKGEAINRFMNSRIDTFVACKIESLPFEDGFFDYVIGSAVLHHTQPQKALSQIIRVLKQGGEFVGTGETAIPRALHSLWASRFSPAGSRERELGVKEGGYSFGQWKRFFYGAGFPYVRFTPRMYPRYKQGNRLINAFYQITSRMPQALVLNCLPCVAVIFAAKSNSRATKPNACSLHSSKDDNSVA
jgi:SAM-dependent methyltransferase